jgi:hypothetical protein
MKSASCAFLVLLLLAVTGCSSVSVTSDYDPSVSFTGLKTYQWIKLQGTGDVLEKAPLIMKRAMNAVDKALVAKGYSKADSDNPDFYVAVHAGVKDKINVTNYGYNYGGWYGGYGGMYGRGMGGTTDVSYYKEGTIFVDVIQKKGEGYEMMWRGAGTGTVDPPNNPEEAQAKADQIAMQILEQFPPKAK